MDLAALPLLVALTLGPAPAQEPSVPVFIAQGLVEAQRPDRPAAWLTITYGGLVGADIGVTAECIGRGVCREANPLLRGLVDRPGWFGFSKAALNTGLMVAAWRLTRPHSWQRYAAMGALVVVQGLVVAWNARQLRRP